MSPKRFTALVAASALFFSGLYGGGGEITKSNYSPEDAKEFLAENGHQNIQLTDTDTFTAGYSCSRGDVLKYEFSTTAANGQEADVIVCKGIFKAATLRQG